MARPRAAAARATGREGRLPPETPTSALPGIGPTLAARLAERGVVTVEDLIWQIPRRYDDARRITSLAAVIAQAQDGDRVTCAGQVLSCRFHRRGPKRWIEVRLGDTEIPPPGQQAAQILIRWFNAFESMAKTMPRGSALLLSGRIDRRGFHAEMANPDILAITLPGGTTDRRAPLIIPRYSEIGGIPANKLTRARTTALKQVDILDGVPARVAASFQMVPLQEALSVLHAPSEEFSPEQVEELSRGKSPWHRRLVFEDLFLLGLAVARRRRARRADRAVPCAPPPDLFGSLAQALPFPLTGAQRRAIAAISKDLAQPTAMNRLLQGDVGSGKTAVAFAAAYQVASAGRHVAIMAPTEILAEQHLATFTTWCQAVGIRCALLTAATTRKQRALISRALKERYLHIVIGTHALLSESTDIEELGLVIIDEQHRFGVAQRVELRAKGSDGHSGVPHLLVMTATPIPRSLALTAYGDLDVTTIDELPPGRKPPKTMVLQGASGRETAHAIVRDRLGRGEQVYVVCPQIDASDDPAQSELADVVSTAERLTRSFAPACVELVHGRMTQEERDTVMQRFRRREVQILVATTVIEVGVDVPNATVMVILDAHQFGLAQLHQLRGRVGRGGGDSYCLLMTRSKMTPEGSERLAVIEETTDGFRIAEADLRIRGPGELLGERQSGLPALRYGDLRDHMELLLQAREAAEALLDADPELARPEHALTRRALESRTGYAVAFGSEGG